MSALKPARLTGALLTRKGMAAPSAAPATRVNMVGSAPAHREPDPPVANLSDWIAPNSGGTETVERASKNKRPSEKRVRVSLRLDGERHVRLKLVATYLNRTLQSIFTQAIDEFFERHAPDTLDVVTLLRIREQAKSSGTECGREDNGG